jgi:hypothetical protein
MRTIPSLKRDLTLVLSISALVFVCALAWGHPFIGPTASAAVITQTQHSSTQAAIFTGTVLRNGEQFFLRAASGQLYRLDDASHAQHYNGRAVKVTGNLDTEAQLIHVENIEPPTA